MTNWIDKIAALIYSWYPGQIGNIALAEILSGKTNPSGKLPITIEKEFKDSPGYDYMPKGENVNTDWEDDFNMDFPIHNIEYKEGIFVGYRWYEKKKIEPLFPFGYGLSYTTFSYSDLKLSKPEFMKEENVTLQFNLSNTGGIDGAEITQVYIRDIESSVPRPIKELKGFKKVFLKSGESKTVRISLDVKDFAFWDLEKKDWDAEPGQFEIMIGTSSDDIKLKSIVTLL